MQVSERASASQSQPDPSRTMSTFICTKICKIFALYSVMLLSFFPFCLCQSQLHKTEGHSATGHCIFCCVSTFLNVKHILSIYIRFGFYNRFRVTLPVRFVCTILLPFQELTFSTCIVFLIGPRLRCVYSMVQTNF